MEDQLPDLGREDQDDALTSPSSGDEARAEGSAAELNNSSKKNEPSGNSKGGAEGNAAKPKNSSARSENDPRAKEAEGSADRVRGSSMKSNTVPNGNSTRTVTIANGARRTTPTTSQELPPCPKASLAAPRPATTSQELNEAQFNALVKCIVAQLKGDAKEDHPGAKEASKQDHSLLYRAGAEAQQRAFTDDLHSIRRHLNNHMTRVFDCSFRANKLLIKETHHTSAYLSRNNDFQTEFTQTVTRLVHFYNIMVMFAREQVAMLYERIEPDSLAEVIEKVNELIKQAPFFEQPGFRFVTRYHTLAKTRARLASMPWSDPERYQVMSRLKFSNPEDKAAWLPKEPNPHYKKILSDAAEVARALRSTRGGTMNHSAAPRGPWTWTPDNLTSTDKDVPRHRSPPAARRSRERSRSRSPRPSARSRASSPRQASSSRERSRSRSPPRRNDRSRASSPRSRHASPSSPRRKRPRTD